MVEVEIWRTIVPLLLAHLIVDFGLQPKAVIDHKKELKHKSYWLYIHSLLAGVLAYLFVGSWNAYEILYVTAVSHYFIDLWKLNQKENNQRGSFFIDQALHLLVIAGFVLLYHHDYILQKTSMLVEGEVLAYYMLSIFFLTAPTGIFIAQFFKKWESDIDTTNGLDSAGKWIGYCERLLIFFLVLQSQFTAIGFLIAAKSILRLGSQSSDRKQSEYVLLGTLISFTIAIITGVIVTQLTSQ